MEHHDINKCLSIFKKGKKTSSKQDRSPLDLTALVRNLKESLFLRSVQERTKAKVVSPR